MTEVKLDLDGLEALAKAALTPGDGEPDAHQQLVGNTPAFTAWLKANAEYHQAFNPATALALLALAREAEGRKPSLFWDAENLEEGGADVADAVGNYAPGEVVKMQTGYHGPIMWGVQNEAGECAAFATPEEAEAWFATPPSRTQSGEDAA